jgi:hypothetical protein
MSDRPDSLAEDLVAVALAAFVLVCVFLLASLAQGPVR